MHNSPDLWLPQFPKPQPEGHKYDRGVGLVYGGSKMTGAARLAARAAQRIGAGMVILGTAKESLPIYAEALESVIVKEADTTAEWNGLQLDPKITGILIGPGMGLGKAQADLVLATLAVRKACVVDADGLTNFSDKPETLFSKLHDRCVLTPHEGEFSRLFGNSGQTGSKVDRALRAAKITNCIVLLKGAETVIAAPDGSFITNNNAPPWLATAGSGDVLAGLILGLIAQQMPPIFAAAAAAWLHGDIAARFGAGLIAEDLIDGIPAALHALFEITETL